MPARVISVFRTRFLEPMYRFLRQGISPEKLALTVVLGTALGIIPVLGITTVLCAAAALWFRLNMAAIQLINYFVYPLQLLLFVPFLRLGEWMFYGEAVFPFSISEIVSMVRESWWETVKQFWLTNLMGVAAWIMVFIPVSFLIYYLTLPVFRRFAEKNGKTA